MMKTELLT